MKTTYKTLLAALCCTMALNVQAQERTFQRNKVLIEKHTGTGCKACPAADVTVENYIAEIKAENDVAILRHHNYGTSSILNTQTSSAIVGVWGAGAWPAMNVDRFGFFGDPKVRLAHTTGDANLLKNLETIEKRMKTPTYVSLSLEGSSFDPKTNKLRLVLSGEVTKDLPYLRVHAFITQSGIKAYQEGATSDYIHNDAVRDRIMTDAQGDAFKPNKDGTYRVVLEKTLSGRYGPFDMVPADMKVVAFVSSYVDDTVGFNNIDYSTSEVHNADVIELLDLPTASPCAAPTIELKNGAFVCTSSTTDATCHYDIVPLAQPSDGMKTIDLNAPAFTVTAYAEATGYTRSANSTRTFSLRDVLGPDTSNVSDVNGDKRVDKADVEALVSKLLKK